MRRGWRRERSPQDWAESYLQALLQANPCWLPPMPCDEPASRHISAVTIDSHRAAGDAVTDWREFFQRLEHYEAKFQYYECDRGVTAEQLYQAFRGRLLDELSEAANYVDSEDLAIVLQRMIYPPSPPPEAEE